MGIDHGREISNKIKIKQWYYSLYLHFIHLHTINNSKNTKQMDINSLLTYIPFK